jgi:hypothetical protein
MFVDRRYLNPGEHVSVVDGDNSPTFRLADLNLRLSWMQDVIRRYQRRSLSRAILTSALLLLLTGGVVSWFYSPEAIRSTLTGSLAFASTLVALGLLFVANRDIPTVRERVFLELPKDQKLTLPELELHYSRLREARRSHPALGTIDHESQYEDDISFYVEELRARGVRSRRANNTVQVVTIVGSLAATGVGGLALSVGALQWVGPTITFVVGTASGVAAIYKFKDRSFYAQQTANAINQEVNEYQLRIGRYKADSDAENPKLRATFLEEVHRLRTEQENREQNLDQPAQKNTDSE